MDSREGAWEGEALTWLDPSKEPERGLYIGVFTPVLGGRYMEHRYESAVGETLHTGIEIWFWDPSQKPVCCWADTFHTPNDIMRFVGDGPDLEVLGSYSVPGGPEWGWSIRHEVSNGALVMKHSNIMPDGKRFPAIEINAKPRG